MTEHFSTHFGTQATLQCFEEIWASPKIKQCSSKVYPKLNSSENRKHIATSPAAEDRATSGNCENAEKGNDRQTELQRMSYPSSQLLTELQNLFQTFHSVAETRYSACA